MAAGATMAAILSKHAADARWGYDHGHWQAGWHYHDGYIQARALPLARRLARPRRLHTSKSTALGMSTYLPIHTRPAHGSSPHRAKRSGYRTVDKHRAMHCAEPSRGEEYRVHTRPATNRVPWRILLLRGPLEIALARRNALFSCRVQK